MSSGVGVAQKVYGQVMFSDAQRNQGRDFLANVGSGGSVFGDGISDVLGPPPQYGTVPYFARDNVQMYQTQDAYLRTNLTFFTSTIEGMYHMLPSFPSEILPPERTKELHIKGYSYGISKSIAEITPEYALGTYLEQERTDVAVTLQRRAKMLRMNTGFWRTPDGQASFAMQQVMLRNVMLLTMDSERFHALFNTPCNPDYKDGMIKDNKMPHNSLSDMFQKAKNLFAVLHTEKGLIYLDSAMSRIFENDIKPDTYLFPPGAAKLITLDESQTEFYRKGSDSQKAQMDNGSYLQAFLGKTIYEVPDYYIQDREVVTNFATRRVKIGDAIQVRDFYPGASDYTTERTRTSAYNMDIQGGGFTEFDIDTVTKFSGIFARNGKYTPALQDFVNRLNAKEFKLKGNDRFQLVPIRYNASTDNYDLISVIGEMDLAFLSNDQHRMIINGIMHKFDDLTDAATRKALVDGLNLMERLSKPNLRNADVKAYFDAVKKAVGNPTAGIAEANIYGTLDIKSITATGAGALGATAAAKVLPYGYGTWAGMKTLANTGSTGFLNATANDKDAKAFVEAVQRMEKPLSTVFKSNVTFDSRFCPFFLKGSTEEDERLCTFVHSLLAPNIKPAFVAGGASGVFKDVDMLFSSDPAIPTFAPLARQLAFLLGESPSWIAATSNADGSAPADADAKRDVFNATFLQHQNEYIALLNPVIPPGSTPQQVANIIAFNVAARWLTKDTDRGRVLATDANGSVEPAAQLAYNLIRYNLGAISLPASESTLNQSVLNTWANSSLGEYKIMGSVNTSFSGLASNDLARQLDQIVQDAIAGNDGESWVNTRLFIDGSAFSDWAANVTRLPAASRAAAVAALNVRPANPTFPGIPIIGNAGDVVQFLDEMRNAQSEYKEGKNPMSSLISYNDNKIAFLTSMQKMTLEEMRLQLANLMAGFGAPRFQAGNELVTRWNHIQQSESDPVRKAISIMYLLQGFNGFTMTAFKENNVPMPYEGILLRVARRYTAGSVLLLKKGSNLGNLWYGNDKAEASAMMPDVWRFQYSIWFGAMVKRPDHMLLAPDVTVHKYHGGEGCVVHEPGSNNPKADIRVIMVPYGSANGKSAAIDYLNVQYPIDVTGKYNPALYNGKVVDSNVDYSRPTYPGYLFYREYYGFSKLRQSDPFAIESMGVARRRELDNTICYDAGQYVPISPEPNAQLLMWKRSMGPFGEFIPDNSKDARQIDTRCLLAKLPEGTPIYRK